jgi:hypothetical protein
MINGKAVTQADFDAYLKLKRIPAVDADRLRRSMSRTFCFGPTRAWRPKSGRRS